MLWSLYRSHSPTPTPRLPSPEACQLTNSSPSCAQESLSLHVALTLPKQLIPSFSYPVKSYVIKFKYGLVLKTLHNPVSFVHFRNTAFNSLTYRNSWLQKKVSSTAPNQRHDCCNLSHAFLILPHVQWVS